MNLSKEDYKSYIDEDLKSILIKIWIEGHIKYAHSVDIIYDSVMKWIEKNNKVSKDIIWEQKGRTLIQDFKNE